MTAALDTQTRLKEKAQDWRTKYAKNQTYSTLYADASSQFAIAQQFESGAKDLSNITATRRNEAKTNAVNLLKLRGIGAAGEPNEIIPRETAYTAGEYLATPIEWLISVSAPILGKQTKINELGEQIASLPKDIGQGAADLLGPVLDLIKPLLYVVVVVAAIGVGIYAMRTLGKGK